MKTRKIKATATLTITSTNPPTTRPPPIIT